MNGEREIRWQAYQRRAWRLATLLTGTRERADSLYKHVMNDRRTLKRVEPERLDRLIIQRAREWAAKPSRAPGGDRPAEDPVSAGRLALRELPHQAMEAWLLRRVEQLDPTTAARAMDCSKTAMAMHLEKADAHMHERFGDETPRVAGALRDAADALEPVPRIEPWRERGRRRWFAMVVIAGIIIAIIVAVLWAAMNA